MDVADVGIPIATGTHAGESVLLLSRDWRDAEPVRRCLEHEGYAVRLTTTPKEALSLLGTGRFGAVLCDAELGSMTGFEALAEIRRRFPGIWRMVVAGRESVQEMVAAMGRGTVHFCVARPVDRLHLVSTIRHALAGRCID